MLLVNRQRKRVEKICLQCGEKFETVPSELKRGHGKFCSRSCSRTYRNLHNNPTNQESIRKKISQNHADVSGLNNPMYGRRGKLAPGYIDGRNSFAGETYRKVLLAHGVLPKCKLCNSSFGRIEVHHIDGNRENNDLSNLVFLCQKCHLEIAHKIVRDDAGRIVTVLTNKLSL